MKITVIVGDQTHEVEVPDTAHALSLHGQRSVDNYFYIKDIPLPRPKKKVKKWQWVISVKNIPEITSHYYSSDEANHAFGGCKYKMLIPQTEIEVEDV
jgi:hypothetical protein